MPLFRRKHSDRIVVEDGGFVILSAGMRWPIAWNRINQIVADKIDLITIDVIRLTFAIDGDSCVYRIDEDVDGYGAFLEEMQRQLPELAPGWEREVAVPAFAPCTMVIYQRSP